MNMRRRKRERGMTLLEIMIVLAILALVMGLIVGPKVYAAWVKSRRDIAQMHVDHLANISYPEWALQNPRARCPESVGDLNEVTGKREQTDPWGQPFVMRCPPLEVSSLGEDGLAGTADDIRAGD